jgi:hypothetical protein
MIEYTVKVYPEGYKAWYLNGILHREDGPAIEVANGDKSWYLNGKIHREDGPAIEWANGDKSWWINGKQLTEAEHKAATSPKKNASCNGKEVVIDGVTYVLKAKG